MINYSIIIPHKNIPDLLQRCLDSIPIRDDVQIIVIDDNSDPALVDFSNFPGLSRQNTEVYFTKEGKGAGYVRNVGLSKAKGDKVIFIDADDLFSKDLCGILDANKGSDIDLIIYDRISVMSDDLSIVSEKGDVFHQIIADYLNNHDDVFIRCNFHPLHGKIIRRGLLIDNNIKFSETKWSNDILFSTQVGCLASSFDVRAGVLYILTERKNSLTANFCNTWQEFKVRLCEAIKSEDFIKNHNVQQTIKESNSLMRYVIQKFGIKRFLRYLIHFVPLSPGWNHMLAFSLCVLKNKVRND